MILRDSQIKQLNNCILEQFIAKSFFFLEINFPHWIKNKDKMEIRSFIMEIINLGGKYKISKGINLQKLMEYKIKFNYDIPLVEKLESYLLKYDLEESKRVEDFYLSLSSSTYKLNHVYLDIKVNQNKSACEY